MLAGAAIVNGYPLVFYDSADYIEMSLTNGPIAYRTMPYALTVMKIHLGISLWPVVALQALLAAWTIHETMAAFGPRLGRVGYVAMVAFLAFATSLPWYAGQLMPDFFAGLMGLAVIVLAFDRTLAGWRHLLLAAIAVLGGIGHASLMLLLIVVSLAALVLFLAVRRASWRPKPWTLLAATLATVALVPGLHFVATGRAFYSQSGEIFMLARLIQDGIAKKYLDAVCPTPELKLCLYKDRLPPSANDYLWHVDSIFGSIGSWEYSGPESQKIVLGSLRRFPLDHLRAAFSLAAQQAIEFRTGDGTNAQVEATPFIINRYFPGEIHAYLNALQQRERIDFEAINRLHVPVAVVAQLALLVLAVLLWRRGDRLGAALCMATLAVLLLQAAITGALSNPNHRYQSRIIWIAPLMAWLMWRRWRWARHDAIPQ